MKVLKSQEKSAINGALTLDRAPARSFTVYEAFSDRLPVGMIVMVLLSGDQDVVQENDGEKTRELLTDVLFIETLNEIMIGVLRGTSCPIGEWDVTTGRIYVLKFQEKSHFNLALTVEMAAALTVTLYVVFSRKSAWFMVSVLFSSDQL